MTNAISFHQLQSVILQQGIVTRSRVWTEASFRQDMHYKTGDLLELARLIDQHFQLPLTPEQADELTTVEETISLLNRLCQLADPTEKWL